jgi:hypothetical protein
VATRTFQLEAIVPVAPSAVIDFMSDLTLHHGIHPFVVSATIVDAGTGSDGAWVDWKVVERPPLGPLRYTIRFPARMVRTSNDSMVGIVHAAPGCDLTTNTTATVVDGKTVLRESTVVTAPRLLVGYMTTQARVAHARTYSLLPTELETYSLG